MNVPAASSHPLRSPRPPMTSGNGNGDGSGEQPGKHRPEDWLILFSFGVLLPLLFGVRHWLLWTAAGLDAVLLCGLLVRRMRRLASLSRTELKPPRVRNGASRGEGRR